MKNALVLAYTALVPLAHFVPTASVAPGGHLAFVLPDRPRAVQQGAFAFVLPDRPRVNADLAFVLPDRPRVAAAFPYQA